MRQLPAIFLQHAVSAFDMLLVGKQAAAGVATQAASKINDRKRYLTSDIVS
jgi:hypothetical protein